MAAHNLSESLDGNQVSPATDLCSQSSLVYTNLDKIVDVVNEENTVAANSLEESLDRDQSDVNISSESNLFQLADVDEMCSEALNLVKDVGDLLSFQNANISPNPDKMMPHKSTSNLSFSDSDSEGSQKKVSSDEAMKILTKKMETGMRMCIFRKKTTIRIICHLIMCHLMMMI